MVVGSAGQRKHRVVLQADSARRRGPVLSGAPAGDGTLAFSSYVLGLAGRAFARIKAVAASWAAVVNDAIDH